MGIRYSDGVSSEERVLRLLESSSELSSNAPIGQESYGDWPIRYHLSPERANLVRHLNLEGLDVLELGAGMGAVSRHLAEQAKSLTVVEGTERRYEALKSRLRDLSNWSGRVANIQDVMPEAKFDVVFVVGVLEYSELYMEGNRPFRSFMERASRFLKPGGVVVVAIENRLGLKYWNGCAEDHTGRVFDGIMGYSDQPSPRTFSLRELRGIFTDVGFSEQLAQFPFPDYKLPLTVLDESLLETHSDMAGELAGGQASENYGRPQVNYFAESLAKEGLASAGLLGEMANSFLLFGSKERGPIWERLLERRTQGERAWHYANHRQVPICTTFRMEGEALHVFKRPLGGETIAEYGKGSWTVKVRDTAGRVSRYPAFRSIWMRDCHYGDWDQLKERWLHFLRWGMKDLKTNRGLSPKAVDAVATNVRATPSGYEWIDLEWESSQEVSPAWWVFRNVMVWGRDREHFPRPLPFKDLKGLHELLCRELLLAPDYARCLELESKLNSWVHSNPSKDFHRDAIDRFCRRSWLPVAYPRAPRMEERLLRSFGNALWLKAGRRLLTKTLSGYRVVRAVPEKVRTMLPAPQEN